MLARLAVINVVGLTGSLIGPAMPNIARFARPGARAASCPAFPAVTCTAQSNYLTGVTPGAPRHRRPTAGMTANWRKSHFWKQSNHLVTAPKIWEQLRAER